MCPGTGSLCRRAIEISQKREESAMVTMEDVNAAIKEMTTSKAVMAVKHCSVHQRLFLIACMNVERKTGISDLVFMDVEEEHVVLCRMAKLREPTTSDLHSICAFLGHYRLIIAEVSKAGLPYQKLKLNINVQDIITGVRASKHKNLQQLVK
jgi:Cdc6-like AAA superfamily ATPase